MVSPIAQINANRRLAQGVTWAPPISARRVAPVVPLPQRRPAGGDLADRLGAAAGDILTHPAFQQAPQQGGIKQDAVRGLGWLVGNPVSKAVLKPLEILDYPRAATVGTIRQLLESDALEQANRALAKLPGIDYTPIARPEDNEAGFQWGELWRDIKGHEGFGTSIIEPQFGGEGYEDADQWNIWARRGLGFAGDIASDPLMKLGTGTRAAAGLEARMDYLNKLARAQRGAEAESLAAREAAEFAAEHALLGGTGAEQATAATRAAAEAAAQRTAALGGQEAIDVIGRRGVNVASPEQLAAMGAEQHAIRFAGVPIEDLTRRFMGETVAGGVGRVSEATSRAMSRFLSPGKELWSKTAGAAGRKLVTPKGVAGQTLRPATERLVTGKGPLTREVALGTYAIDEAMRVAKGDVRAPSVAYLDQLADDLKGLSKEDRAQLIRVAEETGAENAVTKMGPQMLETMKEVYRRAGIPEDQLDNMVPELKPWLLPNGQMSRYVVPHVLSRDSFRFFNRLRKGQNPLLDYIRRDLGIQDKDLLEEGGFLQRRLFRPNADGSPQKFKIGEEEIEIATGSVAELEEKLGGLLRKHGFEGKLYETDPVEAWRRYIKSVEKDVAVRVGAHEATRLGLAEYAPKLPHAFDPYGREVRMHPAPGETEPRYVRGRTTEQRPALPEQYEWVEDDELTKARNKIILEGGAKGPTQQVINEFGEAATATRENLARSIENTRQYTKAAFERAQAQSARHVERAQSVVDAARARVDKLETEYRELLKESSAQEELIGAAERRIHGIRSVTPKRIKAKQQQRLAEIAESLQVERDRLEALQTGLENALTRNTQEEREAALQLVRDLDDAVTTAETNLNTMRGKARDAVVRRIEREHRNYAGEAPHADHLITAGEHRQALEIVGAADSPAAQRAQELQARLERHTTAQANHRARALELTEQADRLQDRMNALGRGGRTAEQRTRLANARAEMQAQIDDLRRKARTAQNQANTSTRSMRETERRIKDDEWLKAQRTVEWYNEQQSMIETFSNGRDIDMDAAKSRLNAARNAQLRYKNEQRLATQAAAEADMAALEASVRQPIPALEEILGPDVKVRFRTEEADPTRNMPATHVMEVSRGEEAIASMRWNAETGKNMGQSTAPEYERQGIATALWDQATQYAKERALVPPKHAPRVEQTDAGAAWAAAVDARMANKPESTIPTGTESEAAQFARRSLDTDQARMYRADETLRNDLREQIARETRGPGEAPAAEWSEVGRKVAKEPRARQRWRAYNSRRRHLLGEMERIRSEADLTAPPTREAFQAESTRAPKPRGKLPKSLEQYRAKPSGRRPRGKEPWWTEAEVYPQRPDLTSSKRARNARLRKLQDELDKVERWLDKHPEPPMPRPAPRAVKLRAKVGGKTLRLDRQSDVGPLGGATWKLTLPDGVEQTLTGDMAQVMRQAEQAMQGLAARQPDEALLASLREQLAAVEQRMAQHRPELVEHIAQQRQALAQSLREQSLMEPRPIPPPTKEELIRGRFEPKIAQAEQNVRRFGAIDARAELEGIRRAEQVAAEGQIAGLQENIASQRFQQERIHSMIADLYNNRLPDPVNDWQQALDNAEQARQVHQQISDFIEQYATRQRALSIVETHARKGAPTAEDLKRVARRELRPEDAQGLIAAVDDINKWMTNAGQVLPVGVRNRIEAALMAHEQALAALTKDNDLPASALAKMQRDAANGKLPKVLKAQLRKGYEEIGATGDIIIDRELKRQLFGVEEVLDSKLFGRLFTTWTNFFKTYATLTPGFHVRNAISAIFMNATEGVGVREQLRAIRLWKAYRNADDPLVFLRNLPEAERNAFRATFASGSAGQFIEGGVGEARAGASRAVERLFANPATRLSKRFGEWVEGPQRLALGLHTTKAGGDVTEALARITRIHFDYGQVSKFDETMKRVIPFWTFMSRNLPLQFTQMWMKPKMYLAYQSAMRNLAYGTEDQPIIPGYITQAGGTYFGVKTPEWASKIPVIGPPAGMPIVAQPDLPHTRYADDLQRLQNALSGQGLGQMATNLNPLITTPAEFVSRTDFFTGQKFDPDAMVKVGGATLPYAAALSLVGLAQRGPDGNWYIDAAALNAARGLDPNLDRMLRLAPQLGGLESTDRTGASTTARQAESLARYLGLPVRTISEQQQRSAVRSEAFKERDRQRKLVAMGG